MPHESGLTCNHMPDGRDGLCPDCEADYLEDAEAWHEFGPHPEGNRRWQAEVEAMAAFYAANPQTESIVDQDIPF